MSKRMKKNRTKEKENRKRIAMRVWKERKKFLSDINGRRFEIFR